MKRLLITLALLICAAQSGFAVTTYYVDAGNPNGQGNSNSCTAAKSISSPKLTIGGGIGCLSAGDILNVRAGTYSESVFLTIPSGISGSPTTIQGYAGDAVPTMRGSLTLALENYITWSGINIDDAGDSGATTDCILINSGHDITIAHAEISNCQRHGVLTGDGNGANVSNLLFSYLTIHNTGQGYLTSGDPRHHNYYIASSNLDTGPITIDHTESYQSNNPADSDPSAKGSWGIQIYSAVPGHLKNVTVSNSYIHDNNQGIVIGSGTNLKVYNTIIANNRDSNGEGSISVGYGSPSNVQLYNNTITANSGYCIELGSNTTPVNTVIENNICYNNASDAVTDHSSTGTVSSNNMFATDPLFVSSTDFHLTSSSPARNIGANLTGIFGTDRDGNPRPTTGSWDDGAYAFVSGGSTPPPPPPPDTQPPPPPPPTQTPPPAPQNLHLLP